MNNIVYRIEGRDYNIVEYTILHNPMNLQNILTNPKLNPNLKNAKQETVLHILLRTIYCEQTIDVFMKKHNKKIDYNIKDFLEISVKELAIAYSKNGCSSKKRMATIILSYIN